MKKYTFVLAVAAVLALTACGSGSATSETKDSTVVAADSSAKPADSTAAAVDSTAGGAKTETTVKAKSGFKSKQKIHGQIKIKKETQSWFLLTFFIFHP